MSQGQMFFSSSSMNGEHCEIFDLSNDPLEEQNLLGSQEGKRLAADLLDRAHDLFVPTG